MSKRGSLIRAFWYLWRKTGMPSEVRRKFLAEAVGKTSLKEMTNEEIAEVLTELRRLVGEPLRRKTRHRYQAREGRGGELILATEQQLQLIEKLRKEVGFDQETFETWMMRKWKTTYPSRRQAVAIIEALKNMKMRGYRIRREA